MNRAKTILASLRLANSLLSAQIRNSTRTPLSQVTPFSQLALPFSIHSQCCRPIINTHQKLFFSSTPKWVVELLVANDWSTELVTELENSNPVWTHEMVIYILKKLDKHPRKAFDFFNWVCEKDGFRPSSSIYSLLLRILLLEDMRLFWISFKSMKVQGFFLDRETYTTMLVELRNEKMGKDAMVLSHFYKRMLEGDKFNAVVKEVVHIVSKIEWSEQVEEQLDGLIGEVSAEFVIRVLRGLRNYPCKALKFFDWIGRYPGYEHNTIAYNSLARVLGQGYSVHEFWSTLEKMKGNGFDLDLDSYIKISRHLQKNRIMEEAVKLYEFMMDSPYKPSIQDCSMILRRLSGGDDIDLSLMFRVLKKYESAGFELSKSVYDGIHRCFTAAGEFDEAEKIIGAMKDTGNEPDNITYSQLVFGLCKAHRFEEACEVLENMKAIGCTPDIMTWTILIQGHCDGGKVDEALVCFTRMLGSNCDVDADLVEVLIKGFMSQGKVLGAYNLLNEIIENARLKPWQATYKKLIERLLEERRLEEAMNLLRLMKKQNYPPYPGPFVPYISKFGTVDDALDFLTALTVKEEPSSSAYLYVLKSFFKEGRLQDAKDLLFKCPHHIRKHNGISDLFGSAGEQE